MDVHWFWKKNRILWIVRFLTNEKFFKTRKFLKREQIWGLGDFSEMRDFSGLGELTNCGKKKTENIVTRSARLSLRLKIFFFYVLQNTKVFFGQLLGATFDDSWFHFSVVLQSQILTRSLTTTGKEKEKR